MGIFSNPQSDGPPARRRTDPNGISIVAPDMVVTGDLQAEGVVRIEGRVAGNVSAAHQILLSPGGVIEGNLTTREAVLGGEVHGTVTATERVEVQSTAHVHGDIVTPRLLILEGGQLNGGIRMDVASGVPADA